jgi:hypothetical protein
MMTLSSLQRAPSPTRSPWEPGMARGFSVGEASVASARPSPNGVPAGAPYDNVGTGRFLRSGGCPPNIVKDGTPQIVS